MQKKISIQQRKDADQMSLTNSYHKGWALRYMREAKAELTAAQKTPYMAPGLILEALRKAQAAIYYSMGDPPSIEAIVRQTVFKKELVKDPALRCLVEIERTVQEIAAQPDTDLEKNLKQANEIVQTANDIVKLFTGENVD